MNCEACHLKELEVEPFEIREVLRCILHTVVFHRALGLVRPKDIDCELFEITYVQCGDGEVEKKIEEKIEQFIVWVEKHPNKKSQVSLYNCDPPKYFITSELVSPAFRGERPLEQGNSRRAALEASIREVLFQIIKFVNEKRDHIPPVPNLEGVSFPYDITIPSSSDSSFGMDMFKRMLQTGHPTMLS